MFPTVETIPITTFPTSRTKSQSAKELFVSICKELDPILILSDSDDCNRNFSVVLKTIVDFLNGQKRLFHLSSKLALKVIRLNLFVKNYGLCIGKLLSLIEILSHSGAGDSNDSRECLQMFVLVMFLLMLKISSEDRTSLGKKSCSNKVSSENLLLVLEDLSFLNIVGHFISQLTYSLESTRESYFLLKLNCDIVFQYLYEVVMLSEVQFNSMANSDLVPNVVDHLLSMADTSTYTLRDEGYEELKKLISYEEFKLILLLNEQFMMRNLTTKALRNKVFETLTMEKANSKNGICAFINILVYYMNREESHIIKILMLKFLYLVFTSSYSAKLPYLNDMKILIDIMLRELNDLNYCSVDDDSSLLALTYVKVLFPILKFSPLCGLSPAYKPAEITSVLTDIIVNCESVSKETRLIDSHSKTIVETAIKCLSIAYLKVSKPAPSLNHLIFNMNDSNESVNSQCSVSSQRSKSSLQCITPTESFSIARVSSVRATNVNDYNKTKIPLVARAKNENEAEDSSESILDLSEAVDDLSVHSDQGEFHTPDDTPLPTILIPDHKELPKLPIPDHTKSPVLSIPDHTILPTLPGRLRRFRPPICSTTIKGKQKKAPPPPPPPPPRSRRVT